MLDEHPSLPFPHSGREKSCGRSPLTRYGALIIVSLVLAKWFWRYDNGLAFCRWLLVSLRGWQRHADGLVEDGWHLVLPGRLGYHGNRLEIYRWRSVLLLQALCYLWWVALLYPLERGMPGRKDFGDGCDPKVRYGCLR